jgi:hypothetical protein
MKLNIEEVENGFIVEEITEVKFGKDPLPGKKYVFTPSVDGTALDSMQKFITDFYSKRPHKNSRKE